jgi:copper(I)-binding protein
VLGFRSIVVVLFCLVAGAAASAHSVKKGGIEIVHPWCHAAGESSGKTTAVYMKITNRAKQADRLVGASAAIADKVVLQGPLPKSGGKERPAVSAIPVAAGGELVFGRSGYWFELMNVNKELAPYDSFKLTLIFKNAGKIEVDVLVEEGPDMHHHH